MTILFLTPYLRRPYELYYFCNLSEDVIIVTDEITFDRYSDSFDEFRTFNFTFIFLSLEKLQMGRFFNFSSTAALVNYNEAQLSKIIENKNRNITTIVSVEMFSPLSVQASRLSSKFSLKHIVIVWENIKRSLMYFVPPFSIYTGIVKSTASKIIAASNTANQSMAPLHISKDKIYTIYPGIFINKFKSTVDSVDKVLFVGNLEPSKGVDILLQAFKRLAHKFNSIKLVLAGSGSLEPEVIKLKKSGYNIDCKGYVPHSILTEVYSDCSIFCSPSIKIKRAGLKTTLQEQFGFTLVEAMASGLPIVSSNIGSIPEVLEPNNIIIEPNADNVFSALNKLITCDDLRKVLRVLNRNHSASRFNALTQSSIFGKAINNY